MAKSLTAEFHSLGERQVPPFLWKGHLADSELNSECLINLPFEEEGWGIEFMVTLLVQELCMSARGCSQQIIASAQDLKNLVDFSAIVILEKRSYSM